MEVSTGWHSPSQFPHRKARLARLSNLWNASSLRWIDPGTSFVCVFVLTCKHGKVLTTHIFPKSRRPKLTGYSGNLVLNGIVNQRKEITGKGKDHKELQSNLGWKGVLEEPNTEVPQNTQSSEDIFFLKQNLLKRLHWLIFQNWLVTGKYGLGCLHLLSLQSGKFSAKL